MKISLLSTSKATVVNQVHYDQEKGKGAVPYNQEIDYMGKVVLMKPSVFLKLAKPLSRQNADSVDFLKEYIGSGKSIGSPFMFIDLEKDPDSEEWQPTANGAKIVGHEGRNRAYAIQELYGDVPMLVHIFFRGGWRSRQVSEAVMDQINKRLIPEGKESSIAGPFWTNKAS